MMILQVHDEGTDRNICELSGVTYYEFASDRESKLYVEMEDGQQFKMSGVYVAQSAKETT